MTIPLWSVFSASFDRFLFTSDVLRFQPNTRRLILAYSVIQFLQSGNGAVSLFFLITVSDIFIYVLSPYLSQAGNTQFFFQRQKG